METFLGPTQCFAESFPPGWVLSTPPACLLWTSFDSMCPCTCNAGLSCAVTCHRKGSSRPLAPTTSTWPCCSSSSSCPRYLPFIPLSPFPLLLTVAPSGKEVWSRDKVNLIASVTIILFFLVGRTVCLMWSKRHLSQISLPGSVKCSATPLTLD